MSLYASIEEVWGEMVTKKCSDDPICSLAHTDNEFMKLMENEEGKASKESDYLIHPKTKNKKKSKKLEGYNAGLMNDNYFSYDNFFDEYIQPMKKPIEQEHTRTVNVSKENVHMESEKERSVKKKDLLNLMVEEYMNKPGVDASTSIANYATGINQDEWKDIFLYCISGVFLIFMMEQILKLGSRLR